MSGTAQLRRILKRLKRSGYGTVHSDSPRIVDRIQSFLEQRDEPVFLYGFDDFKNLGDQALWLSLDMVMARLPRQFQPKGLLMRASSFDAGDLRDKTLVFPGGGSLGSRYKSSKKRVGILEKLTPAAIIQMPASTSFLSSGPVSIERVRQAYRAPRRSLVFVRDERSRTEALSELGLEAHVEPDLTSALPDLGDLHVGGNETCARNCWTAF